MKRLKTVEISDPNSRREKLWFVNFKNLLIRGDLYNSWKQNLFLPIKHAWQHPEPREYVHDATESNILKSDFLILLWLLTFGAGSLCVVGDSPLV